MWETFLPRLFSLAFLFLFITLFLMLLPVEIRITIDNLRKDNSISGQFIVSFGEKIKLLQIKKTFPATLEIGSFLNQCLELWKERGKWYKSGKEMLSKTAAIVYRLMRAGIWKKFDLRIKFGCLNPAQTALLTGFLRYISGRGTPHILHFLSFRRGGRPRFLFYPSFQKNEFVFLFAVEFTVSGLKLLYYGIKILYETVSGLQRLNLWRQSGKWQNIQSKV